VVNTIVVNTVSGRSATVKEGGVVATIVLRQSYFVSGMCPALECAGRSGLFMITKPESVRCLISRSAVTLPMTSSASWTLFRPLYRSANDRACVSTPFR
jgi:hypothetical protein